MKPSFPSPVLLPNSARRRFLQGLAAGGVLAGLSGWMDLSLANAATATAVGTAPVLSGTEFS